MSKSPQTPSADEWVRTMERQVGISFTVLGRIKAVTFMQQVVNTERYRAARIVLDDFHRPRSPAVRILRQIRRRLTGAVRARVADTIRERH